MAIATVPSQQTGAIAETANLGIRKLKVDKPLAGLQGAKADITLDIEAAIPDGVPENVVRTVTENCRTLKFKSHGFENS